MMEIQRLVQTETTAASHAHRSPEYLVERYSHEVRLNFSEVERRRAHELRRVEQYPPPFSCPGLTFAGRIGPRRSSLPVAPIARRRRPVRIASDSGSVVFVLVPVVFRQLNNSKTGRANRT